MARSAATIIMVLSWMVACSDEGKGPSPDAGQDAPVDTPLDDTGDDQDIGSQQAIADLVISEDYLTWRCEPAPRPPGAGSGHGRARVCLNSTLETSLETNKIVHPQGSIAVKELYNNDDELTGHAVSVKAFEGDDENAWVWYEAVAPDYDDPTAYGRALIACFACHSGGSDFVFTEMP